MKKLLLALIAAPIFMATAQNLQVTRIAFNPAPQCPTTTNPNPTTTVSVTVVGGTAPYTFSTSGVIVTPTVSGNRATFVFPVAATNATITVTDSSLPALTTSFVVSLFPALFTSATFDFLSPCAGNPNGSITASVTGATPNFFRLNGTPVADTSSTHTFTGLGTGSFAVSVLTPGTAPCSGGTNSSGVSGVQLNAFENSFITNLADYIVRAYCQKCFTRTAPTTTNTVVSSCNSCGSRSSGCNSCC